MQGSDKSDVFKKHTAMHFFLRASNISNCDLELWTVQMPIHHFFILCRQTVMEFLQLCDVVYQKKIATV